MGMLEKDSGGNIKFMEWLIPGVIVSTATIVDDAAPETRPATWPPRAGRTW